MFSLFISNLYFDEIVKFQNYQGIYINIEEKQDINMEYITLKALFNVYQYVFHIELHAFHMTI